MFEVDWEKWSSMNYKRQKWERYWIPGNGRNKCNLYFDREAGLDCWLEHRTCDRKVASSNPGRNGGIIFFCRVNFVCCSYSESVPPRVPQWHIKDLGHSDKSAGGRLHLNTPTPFTQRSRIRLIMPLSRQSVGTYQETSSHATRQGTLSHSRLSSLSHSGPVSYTHLTLPTSDGV